MKIRNKVQIIIINYNNDWSIWKPYERLNKLQTVINDGSGFRLKKRTVLPLLYYFMIKLSETCDLLLSIAQYESHGHTQF